MKPKPLAVSIRLTWLVDMPCHLPRYYISTVLFIYLFCCQYSVLVTRGDKKKKINSDTETFDLFIYFPLACFGAMQHSCYSSTWLCAVRQCQSPWGATKTCSLQKMETKASDLEVKEQLCVSTLLLFHHFNTQGSAVGFELRYLARMKSHLI